MQGGAHTAESEAGGGGGGVVGQVSTRAPQHERRAGIPGAVRADVTGVAAERTQDTLAELRRLWPEERAIYCIFNAHCMYVCVRVPLDEH